MKPEELRATAKALEEMAKEVEKRKDLPKHTSMVITFYQAIESALPYDLAQQLTLDFQKELLSAAYRGDIEL